MVLPRAATGHPSAHGGQVEALREVPDGESMPIAQLALEIGTKGAGACRHQPRLGVDGDDAGHPAQVEQHPAAHRHGAALHPAASTGDGERDVVLVAQRGDGGHLRGRGRPGHHRGAAGHLPGQRPVQRQRPPVAARLGGGDDVGRGGADRTDALGETLRQRRRFTPT